MKKGQSVLRIVSQSTVLAAKTFPFRLDLDFAQSAQITSLSGVFEGKWRTALSGQIEVRPITVVRIDFSELLQQWRQPSGKIRAPAGHHSFESQLAIGEECPGTFSSKNGHVEYAFVIKIRVAGRIGNTEFVENRPVNVVPVVDLSPFAQHLLPVTRCKTYRRKMFCISKANINLAVRLDKTAFLQGESMAINGEIINEHQSNVLKGGMVELIMTTRYVCKRNEKTFDNSLVHFAISAVPPKKHICFEHFFQTSYKLSITLNECAPFEIPIVIGTKSPAGPMQHRVLAIADLPPNMPQAKAEPESPPQQTYPAFFPAPPPPYAFPYGHPGAQFIPPYIPYRTARQQCYLSPQHYYTGGKFEEQSVLQIEEIE